MFDLLLLVCLIGWMVQTRQSLLVAALLCLTKYVTCAMLSTSSTLAGKSLDNTAALHTDMLANHHLCSCVCIVNQYR